MIFSSAVRTLFWVAALLIAGSVLTSIFAVVVENRMVAVLAAVLMAAGFLAGVAWLDRANEDKFWYLNGKRHREDGPAIKYTVKVHNNGNKYWYLNGKLHREDGPAYEGSNGSKSWYLKGKLHREDGPAIEYAGGDKHWYLNDKLHRVDGPAFEYADGSQEWWLNGELHREDGPAIEWADGSKEWYLNGKLHKAWCLNDEEVTEEEHKKRTSETTCEGKVVEIDGVKYELKEV